MNRLAIFLREKIRGRGKQADVGKALGVPSVTISRWMQGSLPAFESCVKLADYFGVPHRQILEQSGSEEYLDCYHRLVEERGVDAFYQFVSLQAAHVEMHRKLQEILESSDEFERAIALNLVAIHRYVSSEKRKRRQAHPSEKEPEENSES